MQVNVNKPNWSRRLLDSSSGSQVLLAAEMEPHRVITVTAESVNSD